MKSSKNKQFATIIKLRHLTNAIQTNWEMLGKTKDSVNNLLDDARTMLLEMGTDSGKTAFEDDYRQLQQIIIRVQQQFDIFKQFIQSGKTSEQDIEQAWRVFNDAIGSTASVFVNIANYPEKHFVNADAATNWKDVWNVIQSNIHIVQGVGEAAYIKVKMMQNFQKVESEILLNTIAKYVPPSFNLLEANKYRAEYLQAVKEIEEEANKNDNLWDRFLNFLAGNIPFKQTPEERVMMRRWLEGERGEL
jgi:cell division septum initiation protein DivIVA